MGQKTREFIMKKRNLVLCLASLCGVGAFAAGYLLLNNDAKIIHSVENDYTVKLISTDFKDNGKIVANATDSGYQLNLDYGHGNVKSEYIALTNGYISNTGIGSSTINGIKSIKIASEGGTVALYAGNNPSLLKKVELNEGVATFDSEVAFFKIVNTGYSIIYYVDVTYSCNRNELGDYIVSGDTVNNLALTDESKTELSRMKWYFSNNADGSLKISDYVPENDVNVIATSGADTYLLDYKRAIAPSNNNVINWSNENDAYELNLPSALEVIKVNVDGEEVTSYEVSGSKISLTYKNASMNRVDVFASDNNVYRFYISKLDSAKRDEAYLTENAISFTKISSAEQFKSIFKLDGSTVEDRTPFYNVYLLDSDIDLEGANIDPIGYQSVNTESPVPFAGQIYGNGHTIKNFSLSKTTSPRSGLFDTLVGKVYDLNLASFTNESDKWSVGGLAGALGGDNAATISNVNIVDATISRMETKPELNGEALNVGAITGYNVKSSIQNCTYNGYVGGLTK